MRIARRRQDRARDGLLMVAVSAVLIHLACGTSQGPPVDYANEPDPRKHGFLLGPSDALRVSVWHNPDLSVETTVRPDGYITLPLLGDVAAAGHTTAELQAMITERLRTFVKDEAAIVTVAVSAINSYRFTVAGNVDKPGVFSPAHYVRFSEAITMAGGPNRFSSPEKAVIQREDPTTHKAKRIPIDYPKILDGRRPEQDLPLLTGDLIYVP